MDTSTAEAISLRSSGRHFPRRRTKCVPRSCYTYALDDSSYDIMVHPVDQIPRSVFGCRKRKDSNNGDLPVCDQNAKKPRPLPRPIMKKASPPVFAPAGQSDQRFSLIESGRRERIRLPSRNQVIDLCQDSDIEDGLSLKMTPHELSRSFGAAKLMETRYFANRKRQKQSLPAAEAKQFCHQVKQFEDPAEEARKIIESLVVEDKSSATHVMMSQGKASSVVDLVDSKISTHLIAVPKTANVASSTKPVPESSHDLKDSNQVQHELLQAVIVNPETENLGSNPQQPSVASSPNYAINDTTNLEALINQLASQSGTPPSAAASDLTSVFERMKHAAASTFVFLCQRIGLTQKPSLLTMIEELDDSSIKKDLQATTRRLMELVQDLRNNEERYYDCQPF